MVTKENIRPHQCIPLVISVINLDRFVVVRVMFGIPKRVTSLRFRALSKMFSSFLGADVSDN